MLGFATEVRKLLTLLSDENRYIDIAIKFVVCKLEGGIIVNTGDESKVYGGKYDIHSACYDGEAENVIEYKVSKKQYDLIHDNCARIEVNGGRGSAKSYAGCLWVFKKIIEREGIFCEIAGSQSDIVRNDWFKMLSIIPFHFFQPGMMGIRKSDREMHLINGSYIRYRSCKNIATLRSWGGHCAFVDEEQDVKQEALDVIWPSLRLSSAPQLLTAGTPMRGEYEQRHKRNIEMQASGKPFSCHRFETLDNIFVPPDMAELGVDQMDEDTYKREILADWGALYETEPLVFRCFTREKHSMTAIKGFTDITMSYTQKKLRAAKQFIIGVDPNWDYPNYAVVYKVFKPDIWVAIDVVSMLGHCGDLARELKKRGYKNAVIISDASGRYNRGPRSSDRLMRAEGFIVTHDYVNPFVTDSIDAMLEKMNPAKGDIRWFLKLPECNELAEAMEILCWGKTGKTFNKQAGVDHVIDAARYPISFFEPVKTKRRKN